MDPTIHPALNDLTLSLKPYPMTTLTFLKDKLLSEGKTVIDFGIGDPLIPLDPKVNEIVRKSLAEISQYPSLIGRKTLHTAFHGYLDRRFGISPKLFENKTLASLPSHGSKEAIFHIHLSIVGRGGRKKVIYPDPGYPVYKNGIKFAGGIPVPFYLNEENDYLLTPWTLPKSEQKEIAAVWINYPHNPTGKTVDLSYLGKIVDWCQKNDVILLSDDCYQDIFCSSLENKKEKHPPIPLQITHKNIISFMTLSKRSGFTGFRSGMMAGDASLFPPLIQARSNFGVASQDFVQQAAAYVWTDDEHVIKRREIFSERMDTACNILTAAGLLDIKPEATLYIWARVPKKWAGKDVEFATELAKLGVIVTPSSFLSDFCTDYFRIALVPELKETQSALEILHEFSKHN